MTKSDILKYLKNKKDELSDIYGITSLGLYGSYARDEATESSDIDLFYKTNEKFTMGILEFSELLHKLESDLNSKNRFCKLRFYGSYY